MNNYQLNTKPIKKEKLSKIFEKMTNKEVVDFFLSKNCTHNLESGGVFQGEHRYKNIIYSNSIFNESNFFFRVDKEGRQSSPNYYLVEEK